MKKTLFILSIILIFPLITNASEFGIGKTPITITKIVDGDTVQAKIDKNKFSIRLIGIDCYETCAINRAYKQAYYNNMTIEEVVKQGNKFKEYLKNLYEANKNTNITLDFKGVDKYNRVLGIIYFDELNVNQTLKLNGGCQEYNYE